MGVLIKSGSALKSGGNADRGVPVFADVIADVTAEGKLLVTGVASFSSLGLGPGILRGNIAGVARGGGSRDLSRKL